MLLPTICGIQFQHQAFLCLKGPGFGDRNLLFGPPRWCRLGAGPPPEPGRPARSRLDCFEYPADWRRLSRGKANAWGQGRADPNGRHRSLRPRWPTLGCNGFGGTVGRCRPQPEVARDFSVISSCSMKGNDSHGTATLGAEQWAGLIDLLDEGDPPVLEALRDRGSQNLDHLNPPA